MSFFSMPLREIYMFQGLFEMVSPPIIAWNKFPSKEKNAETNTISIRLARAAKGEMMNKSKSASIKIVSNVLFIFFTFNSFYQANQLSHELDHSP
ncbi:hypothetical protein [Nostoc sp. JL33]|uniref:hypothetical protein n=1 Tax=Nostoc sp. JL33 TaxID=2815396 RepID=UPI0025EDC0B7|nr:hypothetical protein [Nostoc sp. JL33]MBN3871097.1 hypothetical protein [Nostoc sp. JL33]